MNVVVKNGSCDNPEKYGLTTTFHFSRNDLRMKSKLFERELEDDAPYRAGESFHLNTYCGTFQVFVAWLFTNKQQESDPDLDVMDDFVLDEFRGKERMLELWELSLTLESRRFNNFIITRIEMHYGEDAYPWEIMAHLKIFEVKHLLCAPPSEFLLDVVAYQMITCGNFHVWLEVTRNQWETFAEKHKISVQKLAHKISLRRHLCIESRPSSWACHRWHEHETEEEKTLCRLSIAPDSAEAKECDRYVELQKATIGAEDSLLSGRPMSNSTST